MRYKAFTLIELLTVIGIIAVLAAILFPVFAQAKIAAYKTTDLSNLKQIGTGAMLYESDADENFPVFVSSYCASARIQNPLDPDDKPGGTDGPGRHPMWQSGLHPYLRSWHVYFSPLDQEPVNRIARFMNLSYGYNYGYLSTLQFGPDPAGCGANQWFSSKTNSFVDSPARTIAFADSAGAAVFKENPNTLGSLVNPPDAWLSTENFYGQPEVGWGFACHNAFYGSNFSETDGFAPRFAGGGNASFVDGHVANLQVGAAAAGTNFNPDVSCALTRVIDKTKYLWDPRGANAPSE